MRTGEFLNNIIHIEFTGKISLGYWQGAFGEQANTYEQLFLQKKSEKLNSFHLKIKYLSSRLYKLSSQEEMNNSNETSFYTNPDMLLIYWGKNHLDLFAHKQELIRNMQNMVFPFDNYPYIIFLLVIWRKGMRTIFT